MNQLPSDQTDLKEYQRLCNLGKQGKLFTVEVVYYLENEVKKMTRKNMEDGRVKEFRVKIFQEGLTIIRGEGHWSVVPPGDIVSLDIYRQAAYFGG